MSQLISGFLFDREMQEAGFTRHEMSNQRLRDAAYQLLVRGQLYRFDDADEIEYGVSGPFNDDEHAAPPAQTANVAPAATVQSGEAGYAFRCDGKLWVVTDPEVAAKWKASGFEVTPVFAPQPSQPVEAGETCKCRRLGDWKGFHHPLCDQAPAPSAVVLDDERAALRDMLEDARAETAMIRDALGVPYEPHQTLLERTLDAVRAASPQATATQPAGDQKGGL